LKIPIEDVNQAAGQKAPGAPVEEEGKPGDAPPGTAGAHPDAKTLKRKRQAIEKKELPKKKRDEINRLKEIIGNFTEELKQREQELVMAEEKAKRAVADAQNYKKRLDRESGERAKFALAGIVESLLPVLDNLDKATQAAGSDSSGTDQLVEGLKLTSRQFYDILNNSGLERLDVEGKPFDPETSEAVHMEDSTEVEDGAVLREFVTGYKFKGRVIRPAKVVISSNRPQAPEKSTDEKKTAG